MTPRASDPIRAGYTLAEATLAIVLAGVLTLLLAGILSSVGRLAATQNRLSGDAETERAVAAILGAELRTLTAADAGFGPDSVRLRAFRGAGVVCAAAAGSLLVGYRGVRLPEPDKDSILLVWPGFEAAYQVTSVVQDGGGDCASSGSATPLRIAAAWRAPDSAPPALALVFETGAYSIAASALRYRRGAGGRQPLTQANLSDAGSGMARADVRAAGAAALVTLLAAGAPDGAATTWTLLMPQGAARPAETP